MTTAQLTQADLSRKAGLAGATVSRLMRGHNVPDPETVEKIAKVTGVPFRYLFMGETEPASPLFENEGDLFRSVPMNRGFVGAGPAMLDDDEKSDEGRPYAFQKKLTAPKTPAPRAAGRSFGSAPGPRRQRSPDPVSAGGRASATTSRPATRTPAKPCPRFPAFRAEALASNSFSANLRRHHSASTQATGLHRSPRGRDCREAIGCPGTVRSRINPPGPDRRLRASR